MNRIRGPVDYSMCKPKPARTPAPIKIRENKHRVREWTKDEKAFLIRCWGHWAVAKIAAHLKCRKELAIQLAESLGLRV